MMSCVGQQLTSAFTLLPYPQTHTFQVQSIGVN
jgi:hypothetical protein